MDAEFQIAQGAATDARQASAFQACQAQSLGAQLDDQASQRRGALGAGHGALPQMGVAQGVAGQSVL